MAARAQYGKQRLEPSPIGDDSDCLKTAANIAKKSINLIKILIVRL